MQASTLSISMDSLDSLEPAPSRIDQEKQKRTISVDSLDSLEPAPSTIDDEKQALSISMDSLDSLDATSIDQKNQNLNEIAKLRRATVFTEADSPPTRYSNDEEADETKSKTYDVKEIEEIEEIEEITMEKQYSEERVVEEEDLGFYFHVMDEVMWAIPLGPAPPSPWPS